MGWLDSFQDDHNEVHHKGSYAHDAIAGAAAYEAAKAYEDHLAANGKPDSYAKAKEILAGLAAAGVTQLVETKGFDAWDEHKHKQAVEKAQRRLEETVLVREDYSNDY